MPVSVVPHRAHVVASPQRRPLRSRPRLACQQVAATPSFARAAHSAMAHLFDRCGTFRRPTAISTQQAVHFGTQTPAAGFAPPTRHTRSPIFSPHATYRRLISSYKFLLSPSLLPVAAPIALRSARSAIVLRASGRFAPHSFPLHGGEVPTGLFFIFRFCPSSPLRPPPFRHPPPWRCPVRRSAAVPPRPSAAQSPESRLCGGLSASIHPLHPPIARAPRL